MEKRLVIEGNSVYEIDETCENAEQIKAGEEKENRKKVYE